VLAIMVYRLRGIQLVGAMIHGYRNHVAAVKLLNGWLGIALAAAAAYALFIWIN
jgi:hypothetical protein